ncbi:hypothetical protein CgunFtcFv8_004847 [Champsocephalus gunnari]|uniref:Uncharacterized protein n=1 Tax=Champsocephalus gunnari TaxID=52237 RepID=A0AAN8HYJ7_CHAGU|nr:hypothetical protein CgunFtcFv8_004847 [Champsocephalus gunnari]
MLIAGEHEESCQARDGHTSLRGSEPSNSLQRDTVSSIIISYLEVSGAAVRFFSCRLTLRADPPPDRLLGVI